MAVRLAGLLDGNAYIGGSIDSTGEDASAVVVEGDVTGRLIF